MAMQMNSIQEQTMLVIVSGCLRGLAQLARLAQRLRSIRRADGSHPGARDCSQRSVCEGSDKKKIRTYALCPRYVRTRRKRAWLSAFRIRLRCTLQEGVQVRATLDAYCVVEAYRVCSQVHDIDPDHAAANTMLGDFRPEGSDEAPRNKPHDIEL